MSAVQFLLNNNSVCFFTGMKSSSVNENYSACKPFMWAFTVLGLSNEVSENKYARRRQHWLSIYRIALFVCLTGVCLFTNIWFFISPKSKTFFEFGIKTYRLLESQMSLISFLQLTFYGKKIANNYRYLGQIDNELHDVGIDNLYIDNKYNNHIIVKFITATLILSITFLGTDYVIVFKSPFNLEISFSFLLISFVNVIYNVFSNVVLTMYCFSVKNKFSLLNKVIVDMNNYKKINVTLPRVQKIVKVLPLGTSILKKIKIIKKSHAALIKTCNIVNSSAGHKIFVSIVFTTFMMTGSTYTFFNAVFSKSKEIKDSEWIIILSVFTFVINCAILFSRIYLCTTLSEEVRFNYRCPVKL